MAGMRLKPLLHLLGRNSVSFTPRSIGRILFLLQSALWSSLFACIERMKYDNILKTIPVPTDPVFIVGHWRTGTTFLHQLLGKDPQNTVPTLFQVAVPDSFLVSYPFYNPLISSALGKYRPMDYVEMGINEPQEDEYALFRLTGFSPLEKLILPGEKSYFLATCRNFLPEVASLDTWDRKFIEFYRKLTMKTGNRIVSKNPFNSFRIPHLSNLFPDACFIHIVRNPCDVIPSTRHLWQVVQRDNMLNRNHYVPGIRETAEGLLKTVGRIETDLNALPANRWVEIRYEDLEKNPPGIIKELYGHLGLLYSEEYDHALRGYLKRFDGFRKNKFSISPDDLEVIRSVLSDFMHRYNYS
jgi:hypothetical protein